VYANSIITIIIITWNDSKATGAKQRGEALSLGHCEKTSQKEPMAMAPELHASMKGRNSSYHGA
jgi:hypothetical protein